MSLIRNGGFERGNTDFWEVISGGTLEVSTISPLYGTYCGKFIANGTDDGVILSKDYIEVKPYQILDVLMYMKSGTTVSASIVLYKYDADYSLISKSWSDWVSNDGTFLELSTQVLIPKECTYIRIGIDFSVPANGDIFYLDGISANLIDDDSAITGGVVLLTHSNYTSSGSTDANKKSLMQFSSYYAELYCSSVSGSSPTLDVEVKGYNYEGYNISLGSFTTVTSPTEERIDLPHCLGKQMYLVYTIGGTDPSFWVGVAVVGKR